MTEHKIPTSWNQYFFDEAGDLNFFGKRQRPLKLGENNVSRHFLLGFVKIKGDVNKISKEADALRNSLLKDPFIKEVRSVQESTRFGFHAKNDCSVVRREFFNFLKNIDCSVHVLVRRKDVIFEQANAVYKTTKEKRLIKEKEIYHKAIERILRNNLHKGNTSILFSQRGDTFTNKTLHESIDIAKRNFLKTTGIANNVQISIDKRAHTESFGLQVIDYFLWALFQLYEQKNSAYYELLANKYKLIIDQDDTREKPYGKYYGRGDFLSLSCVHKEEAVSSTDGGRMPSPEAPQ